MVRLAVRQIKVLAGSVLLLFAAAQAQAQTFTVLHRFTGPEGSSPAAGLTMDRAGNLYGTAMFGGDTQGYCYENGCGTVFRLARKNSGWVFSVLYTFSGPDGAVPMSRVMIGPDGALYGTTFEGGAFGDGVVFRLQPPATFCRAISCPWAETILHSFAGGSDGADPTYGDLTFDAAGNLYGTTQYGGPHNAGTVFELMPSNGHWAESILYSFQGMPDGVSPLAGVTFDAQGNLYGTTYGGGTNGAGTVYELMHSSSGWTETLLHTFTGFDSPDGELPAAGLISDTAGNLYGISSSGYLDDGGAAFELTPSNGGWAFNVIYDFNAYQGSFGAMTFGPDGKLYGTLLIGNVDVFQLTRSGGQWTQTGINGGPGGFPFGNVIFDPSGTIYYTAAGDGGVESGLVVEITP